jgi:hypothetical protein
MRDDRIQHAGPFPQVKGSRIDHDKLKAFVERNYEADAAGRWFFQNGPQRVYVQLEAAPWVWRLQWPAVADDAATPRVTSHTGRAAVARSVWLDDEGRLYLDTGIGFGIVHSQDMLDAAQAVDAGSWQPQPLAAADAPRRFGYQREPAPD